MNNKKLYRSKEDRIFFGVMGGLGEYFSIDATLIRVFYVFLCVFTAVLPGVLAYILVTLIVPERPKEMTSV